MTADVKREERSARASIIVFVDQSDECFLGKIALPKSNGWIFVSFTAQCCFLHPTFALTFDTAPLTVVLAIVFGNHLIFLATLSGLLCASRALRAGQRVVTDCSVYSDDRAIMETSLRPFVTVTDSCDDRVLSHNWVDRPVLSSGGLLTWLGSLTSFDIVAWLTCTHGIMSGLWRPSLRWLVRFV
jgi:hypothetical protein